MNSRRWDWIWLCIFISVTPVGAQPSVQPSIAQQQFSLIIPPQPLEDALNSLSRQTHLKLAFYADLGRGLISPRIAGNYTLEVALRLLLANTGLRFKYLDADSVAILPNEPSENSPKITSAISSTRLASESEEGGTALSAPGTGNSELGTDRSASKTSDPNQTDKDREHNQRNEREPDSNKNQISTLTLEDYVVTAQKREERLQNVPISISVMSGADLDRSTVHGVTEALNTVPGVATQQNYLGGGTVVVIRGVAPARTFASGVSPVAYYLDSIPFGLVRSAIGPDSAAYDLERVEVLRGPQGTLYGAGALSGVVRVLTHDADLSSFDLKARISDSDTQYGGNNYRGDMAVNVPIIEDKLAVRAVLGYESDSGWIDHPNRDNANNSEVQTYRLKINAQPTEHLSIGLSAWSSRDNAGAPSVGYTFDKGASVLNQPTSTYYDAYGAKIIHQLSTFSVSSATSYLDYSNKGSLGLDVPYFNGPGSIFFTGIRSHIFSQEVNLNSSIEGAWRWSAGGMYRRGTENDLTYFTGLYAGVPRTLSYNTSKSYAVFGELTRRFLQDRLELTAGLRHYRDDVSVDQGSPGAAFTSEGSASEANTPRGVITWHATEKQMVYASYSQGFRSGFPQVGLPPGFPTVLPDRLTNYEVGSKGSLMDGRVAYDTSIYYMRWQGIQAQLSVPYYNVRALAVVNGEGASGVGADLSLSVEPMSHLSLKASVSWNSLELDGNVISADQILFHKGDRPTSSPAMTAGLSTEYLFALGLNGLQGRISASANYTSSQAYRGLQGRSVVIQRGDPIVLSRTSFSIDSPNHWTTTLYVDNINNERGAPVRAFVGVDNWDARVRPRTVGVQCQYRYK